MSHVLHYTTTSLLLGVEILMLYSLCTSVCPYVNRYHLPCKKLTRSLMTCLGIDSGLPCFTRSLK